MIEGISLRWPGRLGRSAYAGSMTQWGIDALFNPGKRHMDEEKRRLQSTRQEIGDSSGGKRIDLKSGKVTLKGKPKHDQAETEDSEALDGTDAADADLVEEDDAAEPEAEAEALAVAGGDAEADRATTESVEKD